MAQGRMSRGAQKTKTEDIRITNFDVSKFQKTYKKCFGKEINKDEAREELGQLIRLMRVVYLPISLEQLKYHSERMQKGII